MRAFQETPSLVLCARAAALMAAAGMAVSSAAAQPSFGLDDNPRFPIVGPLGFGNGAEDPFGWGGPPLAPSPSLGFLGLWGDGAWLSPGPLVQHPGVTCDYVDSFSVAHNGWGVHDLELRFSIDRATRTAAGSAAMFQVALGQAHGDIFSTTQQYLAPGNFAGTLLGLPFAGYLPSLAGGFPGNVLLYDESAFGLLTPFGVVGPGVPVPMPVQSFGLHDNVDSFENALFDIDGDSFFDVESYFTVYPDEAAALGASPADIFVVAMGDQGSALVPYAPWFMMGLSPFEDSIDGLVMYDQSRLPLPMALGGPGQVEPVIDYALFTLSPGSSALQLYGLDPGDIFFTDFTGAFAVYAPSFTLGLVPTPPGLPFRTDNADALDLLLTPCPVDMNGDGILDNGDIQLFVQYFLNGNMLADMNGDGLLDNGDIQLFVQLFLASCG